MAKYRQLHISFWQDPYVEELEPLEKFFYIYLMTNSKTTQCGCYETSMKLMSYETGLDKSQIKLFIDKFSDEDKIIFDPKTKEFLLVNWLKHNSFGSPKVKKCIEREMAYIKNVDFRNFVESVVFKEIGIDRLLKSMHSGSQTKYTGSQKEEEEEQKQEEEQEEEAKQKKWLKDYKKVVDYYRYICNQFPQPRSITDKRKGHIEARISEYDLKTVFDVLETINESDFLNKNINSSWLNFDWFWNVNNFAKIVEGNYNKKVVNNTYGSNQGHRSAPNYDEEPEGYEGIGYTV